MVQKRNNTILFGPLRFVLRRFVYGLLILIALSAIAFFMLNNAPGDPTQMILGQTWTPQRAKEVRITLGLDKPLIVRYFLWLCNALQGDLGRSYTTHEQVLLMITRALPNSLELAAASLLIALPVGISIGIYSAVHRKSLLDYFSRVFAVSVSSMPIFWLGLLFIDFFAVQMPLFPTGGINGPLSIVLPACSLAFYSLAGIVRMTRSSMLEVLRKDYVRTARAFGFSERVVTYQHALRNALIPVVTLSGLYLGTVIGSAIITEEVFAWPGLGSLIISGVFLRDTPVVLGGVLTVAVFYLMINLCIDFVYVYLDPRIKLG